MEHEYYSPREAAKFLGLAPLTLANWRSRGEGPTYMKFGECRTDRIVYRLRFLKLWRAKYEKHKRKRDQRSIARKIAEGDLPVGWPVQRKTGEV